ncbi:MAG: alpha/beta hydrolase [Flammeovirgaceae bacterium]|nr:alpha/beta hydrolase [Flammeovirgaceae bacterium]
MSEEKLNKYFEGKPVQPELDQYTVQERTINYLSVGADTLPLVLFVHGAPGSLDAFIDFVSDSAIASKARLVSVDRPGYGYSGFGDHETSIKKQAAMIQPILETNKSGKPAVLVGHSYGGPIVARMAMDFPEQVGALVMAAPAIDPEHEKIFWISYPADWFLFRWMVPVTLRVSNYEKLSHVEELTNMLPLWNKVKVPTIHIHGEKDKLVPFENAAFAEKMITNAPLEMVTRKDMGHLIPWNNPELIYEAIYKSLEELENIRVTKNSN